MRRVRAKYVRSKQTDWIRAGLLLAVLAAVFLSSRLFQTDLVRVPRPVPSVNPAVFIADHLTVPDRFFCRIIDTCLPLVSLVNAEFAPPQHPGSFLPDAVYLLSRARLGDPRSFLASQAGLFDSFAAAAASADAPAADQIIAMPDVIPEPVRDLKTPDRAAVTKMREGEAVVGVYYTHNAETFIPNDGKAKLEGKNGGIFKAGSALVRTLREEYGINTVQSETIHDYPDFNLSYVNSEKTARQMVQSNPSLQVLLDLHRDSGLASREASRVKIDGQYVAKILIIVGTDSRLSHPHWKKNYEFAQLLANKMDSLYPGLLKGVRLRSGRYNQHVHPHALLIEIGSDQNSLDEAERAAVILARVIAEVLEEIPELSPEETEPPA